MIWASNWFSGLGLYFWVRAGFGPEVVGPFATLVRRVYRISVKINLNCTCMLTILLTV